MAGSMADPAAAVVSRRRLDSPRQWVHRRSMPAVEAPVAMHQWTGPLGIAVLFALAWAMSTDRRRFPWRIVLVATGVQFALAWLLLAAPGVRAAVTAAAQAVNAVIATSSAGIDFVFGSLADMDAHGFVFAFHAVPVIIFFGALMAIGYHWGIMQRLIAVMAWCLQRTLRISGVEALTVAANVFVGQTEAPLVVRPYIERLSRSQLMLLMTAGFASIAGSVLGVYVLMLGGGDEARRIEFAKHLLVASLLSAPAAVAMARVMVPPGDEELPIDAGVGPDPERTTRNTLDAAAAGTIDGLKLGVNVAAMLIAFLALVALANLPLEALSEWTPVAEWRAERDLGILTVEAVLGALFTPVAALMGIPFAEAPLLGSLLGQKIFLTELIAYGNLGELLAAEPGPDGPAISPRTGAIAAYALCGFANVPSIGIQIGGIAALAPALRSDLAALGLRAMLAGAFASWCTACVAGLFIAG